MKEPPDDSSPARESALAATPKQVVEVVRDASSSESDVLRRREDVMRQHGGLQPTSTLRAESRVGLLNRKRSAVLLVFDKNEKPIPAATKDERS